MTTFNSLADLGVLLEKEPEGKIPKKRNNAPRKKSPEEPRQRQSQSQSQSQSQATILESQTRVKAFHAIATLSIANNREDLQRILNTDRLRARASSHRYNST